jgi:hypothetical protein
MKFLDKLIDILKRSYAWVVKESPQQADPRICPLCFESITEETKFIKYCPACRNWEVVRGKARSSLFARCKKVGCKANGTLSQRPFLAHENCRRLNPLILNLNDGAKNRVQPLGETFALRWIDVSAAGGRSALRDVKHWTLPIIHGAAENVAAVKAMWFPAELLRLLSSGKGKRVQLRGPADVGKSVLCSIAVNPDSLPGNLQLENFVYASPYVATDMNAPEEQRQPFRFFANALQAIQSLRDWQPLDMPATGPAEALIRAGFYSKIVKRERRALVFYDLAGEFFQEGAGEIVTQHAANSDCIYILIDVSCIPVFEEFIPEHKRKDARKKADFNAKLSASLRQIEGDETPKIIVITKVDLVEIPNVEDAQPVVKQERAASEEEIAEPLPSSAAQAAGSRNGWPSFGKKAALKALSEIKERAEQQVPQTSKEIQDLALSNLERLKSFYDPSDPRQKMIRERLGGETIKGAFFVWTTGLASTLPPSAGPASTVQGNPPLTIQSEPGPQSAPAPDVGTAAESSEPNSSTAIGIAPPPQPQPALVDSQPAISFGVLELVKFTLELE